MQDFRTARFHFRLLFGFVSLFLLLAIPSPQPAAAHPLGNFSVNRYSRLWVGNHQIRLFYVLDMAEIPTFQAWARVDEDGDGEINPEENTAFATHQIVDLQKHLSLTTNGDALPLQPITYTLTFPIGQGDLPTLRLEIEFLASLSAPQDNWQVIYHDKNYSDRLGWQEIIVQGSDEITLLASSVPSESISQELRQYPDDLLQSPLTITQAEFKFSTTPAGTKPAEEGTHDAMETSSVQNLFNTDHFAELITINIQNPAILAGVLALAVGLGAAHALTPGHGKTIVGAYLVGSRGTAKHALFLGLTTTITHTAGVFLFGLLVLFASRFILPEQLYPWLGVLSGLLVVGIGISLLRERWGSLRSHHDPNHIHDHNEHNHIHDHPHDDHRHHNGHEHGYGHHHHSLPEKLHWKSLLALGISGGLLPCPSALVLLLSAIALGRIGFGLVLILAFSIGLAGVLTGIGLILVHAGRLFENLPAISGGWMRVLPVLSALFISLAGLGITTQAILQTGLL